MKKEVIVYVDGGICSQICQYLHGYFLQQQGFKVRYDLAWYVLDGHDLNGKKNRIFDLNKLCPSLIIKKTNYFKAYIYKKFFSYEYQDIQTELLKSKNYLGGYYDLTPQEIRSMRDVIFMNPQLDAENQKYIKKIESSKDSVCVHVRRGDMAQEGYYWKVLSPDYYLEQINKNCDKMFFFFSDDMEWVKKEIVCKLSDVRYELVDHNSDDQGYLDLFLMASCRNFICSSGSLGKIAALLSRFEDKEVILPEGTPKNWIEALQEYIVADK